MLQPFAYIHFRQRSASPKGFLTQRSHVVRQSDGSKFRPGEAVVRYLRQTGADNHRSQFTTLKTPGSQSPDTVGYDYRCKTVSTKCHIAYLGHSFRNIDRLQRNATAKRPIMNNAQSRRQNHSTQISTLIKRVFFHTCDLRIDYRLLQFITPKKHIRAQISDTLRNFYSL